MHDRPVPAPARPWLLLGVAVALLLGVLGFTIGRQIATSEAPGQPIAGGTLIEVHLASDTIILGIFVSQADGRLVLAEPAQVTDLETFAELDVLPLSRRPTSIEGNLLIERAQIEFVGAVEADSSLSEAYVEATGVDITKPSPSSN
jgi:hypothetical protein